MTDPRVHIPVRRPSPALVLYAFTRPAAGAAEWNELARLLPDAIELRVLRPPGRERRFTAPLVRSMSSLLDDLVPVVDEHAVSGGLPFGLIGVCGSAITALHAARRLVSQKRTPSLVVVAGQVWPGLLRAAVETVHGLSDDQFKLWVHQSLDVPENVLRDDEVFKAFEPTIRADVELYESYRYTSSAPLPTRFAVGVPSDQESPVEAYRAWQAESDQRVSVWRLDAARKHLLSRPEALQELIAHGATEQLARSVQVPDQTSSTPSSPRS